MKKICLFLLALFGAVNAHAELNIDITGGKIEPMPIAIAEFTGIEQANNIRQILQNDLESSGLFRVIDKDAYLQKINDIHDVPQFENWQAINAQALVVGNVEMTQDNQMLLSFRLWDVYDGQSTLSKKIKTQMEVMGNVSNNLERMIQESNGQVYKNALNVINGFDIRYDTKNSASKNFENFQSAIKTKCKNNKIYLVLFEKLFENLKVICEAADNKTGNK